MGFQAGPGNVIFEQLSSRDSKCAHRLLFSLDVPHPKSTLESPAMPCSKCFAFQIQDHAGSCSGGHSGPCSGSKKTDLIESTTPLAHCRTSKSRELGVVERAPNAAGMKFMFRACFAKSVLNDLVSSLQPPLKRSDLDSIFKEIACVDEGNPASQALHHMQPSRHTSSHRTRTPLNLVK